MGESPDPGKSPDNNQDNAITQQSDHTRKVLHQIRRARTRLLVCLLTLPVYIIAVWFLLQNQRSTESFMFMYMAVWAGFAIDMARRRCPQCGEQFFVKVIFLNLITRRCVHCGLALDSRGDNHHRKF